MKKKAIVESKIIPFQVRLLAWFNIFGRHHFPWRKEKLTPYQVVIAEILLQRTKAETIEKFYYKFLDIFPNCESIASADVSLIEEELRPIGLYSQRAKRIKDLAIEMVKREGQFPRERQILETIPFLGQYIANAIELQIFNKASPLLDVNMARVLERHFGERQMADIRYDPYLQDLAYRVTDHPQAKALNWAILDFAATVCKARKPLCEKCLFSSSCKFKLKL